MKLKTQLLATALTISLAGCTMPQTVPPVDWSDPNVVYAATTEVHDDFKKITQYKSPSSKGEVFLRAWRNDKDGETSYQIYVSDYYEGGWRFYNSAHDSNGNALKFVSIDRSVISCRNGCSYTEDMGLNVSREYLEKNQDTGIMFKISGKGGETIRTLPSSYIKGFLLKVGKT